MPRIFSQKIDFETLRKNMIKGQLLPNKIVSENLLDAFETVSREAFCPAKYKEQSYYDYVIPVEPGRVILSPLILGRMLNLLNPQAFDKILVIAGSTGYSAALLASICHEVHLLESPQYLKEDRLDLIYDYGIRAHIHEDLINGGQGNSPYTGIIVDGGSVSSIPENIFAQLDAKIGRIVFIQYQRYSGRISIYNQEEKEIIPSPFDASVGLLPEFKSPTTFEFF